VKNDRVRLVVIMILKDTATFHVLLWFLYSVLRTSLLWRLTLAFTYLKVKPAKCLCLVPVVLVLSFRFWSWSCKQRSWSCSCYFGLGLKNLVLFTSLLVTEAHGHERLVRILSHAQTGSRTRDHWIARPTIYALCHDLTRCKLFKNNFQTILTASNYFSRGIIIHAPTFIVEIHKYNRNIC